MEKSWKPTKPAKISEFVLNNSLVRRTLYELAKFKL